MPEYKLTVGLQQSVYGSTESYITNQSADDIGKKVEALLDARAEILYKSTTFPGVRLGLANGSRRSNFYPPRKYTKDIDGIDMIVPEKGKLDPAPAALNVQEKDTDQSRACAQIKVWYNDNRTVIRYLSFIPDQIISKEPASINLERDPQWKTKFEFFVKVMKDGGWGIRARDTGGLFVRYNITNWSQPAPGPANMGAHVAETDAPGYKVGDKVQISGVRRWGTDTVSYNGTYRIKAINNTLEAGSIIYYLAGTDGGEPLSIKLTGTIQKVGHAIYPIQKYAPLRAGVHKRGVPFGSPHGKRKKRISLGS